jgi:hypothetical protein
VDLDERQERPTLLREMAMSRLIGVSLAAGLGLFLAAGSASAQVAPPPYLYNRPTYGLGYRTPLSPYLNLANGGEPAV